MKRRRFIALVVLALAATSGGKAGFARFDPLDTRQVDIEHEFTTETYHDKISYALPLRWRALWRTRRNGLMLSAGSLSQTRFDYREIIKLHGETETPLLLSFRRERFEDPVEGTLEQELRLGWQVTDKTALSILGDGGSAKEFADLGAAVTHELALDLFVEGFYWSVDHYYRLKKPFASDRRSRDPYTAGVSLIFQPAAPTYASLRMEYDHPLRWHLLSEGYTYEYERRRVNWDITLADEAKGSWRLSGYGERKFESKAWYDVPGAYKGLQRTVWFHDLERTFLWHDHLTSIGVMGVWRHAHYQQSQLDRLPLHFANVDYEKSARSERREVGSYVRRSQPLSVNGRHHLETGVYANAVRLAEASISERTEVKLQTAWEYLASDNARVFANMTWDADEVREALYEKRGVRAWGGGNFQVMAVF